MDTKKAVIPVKGMTCVNCAAAIQKDISKLAGVMSANVNFANEKAVIEFDPAAWRAGHDAQLEKAIEVCLDLLKKNPPPQPKRPAYPNYHRASGNK